MKDWVVSMFDESGNAVRPWAAAGYNCACFDLLNNNHVEYVGKGFIQYLKANLMHEVVLNFIIKLKPIFLFGFPPCTDLTVAGTRHFHSKRQENPQVHFDAVDLCRTVELCGEAIGCIWVLENPISMLSSLWRKPDYTFHPSDYGGYLPIDDVHPRFPKYIMPRDAYQKTTCLWASDSFNMPAPMPVEPIMCGDFSTQMQTLGGKSERTKRIRSETPRGFSEAAFLFNVPLEHYK